MMHVQKDLAPAHGRGHQRAGRRLTAPRNDTHLRVLPDAEEPRVPRMNFEREFFGGETPEYGGFSSPGLGVPLRAGPTSSQENERELRVGGLGRFARLLVDEARL